MTKHGKDAWPLIHAERAALAADGPLVSGTTLALVMAITGRTAHCDELDGDGVATLRERCGRG
ncbi:hypothetical protein [Nonomuraea sp. B1E8]|uniref:hypothetical protein n=1 Tax=unclassified Nonomuraea TaxID=2593643 RepID=UPI00325EBF40